MDLARMDDVLADRRRVALSPWRNGTTSGLGRLALLRSSSRCLIDTGHCGDAGELNRQTTEENKPPSRSAYQFSYRLALCYGFRSSFVAENGGLAMSYGI